MCGLKETGYHTKSGNPVRCSSRSSCVIGGTGNGFMAWIDGRLVGVSVAIGCDGEIRASYQSGGDGGLSYTAVMEEVDKEIRRGLLRDGYVRMEPEHPDLLALTDVVTRP